MLQLKVFGVLYFISMVFMYYWTYTKVIPPVLPGDIYINKAQQKLYIPTGASFYLAFVIFLLLKAFLPNF